MGWTCENSSLRSPYTYRWHPSKECSHACTADSLYLYPMKQLLLFGAGKSATVLIDYLIEVSRSKGWRVVIADADESMLRAKTGGHAHVSAIGLSITAAQKRKELIAAADLVISLLPPSLHAIVAKDCVLLEKNLLTASYVDDTMRSMAEEIRAKGLFFLCEMGLDPGIDHMSAMQLVHRIRTNGGKVLSFHSHCGGLVAPENDTNPWHYKISWNPRSVVLAGKAGAVYREKSTLISKKYEAVFRDCAEVYVDELGSLAAYPNRDSLSYLSLYGLDEAETFMRTTLRYPAFCKGWEWVIAAGLTDEADVLQTDGLTIAAFLQQRFLARKIVFDQLPAAQQAQFIFLGWNDDTPINKGACSSADILQWLLEKKWTLSPGDKDMIVMLHEIGYLQAGVQKKIRSSLVVKGEDHIRTAMAKTVGLPLGIAATLVLEGKIRETGLHIPVLPSIYEPVLEVLRSYGILFKESGD